MVLEQRFRSQVRVRDVEPQLAGPVTYGTLEEERLHRQQKMTAALRAFGKFNYDEHVAGHFSARDPELLDHFWVNPLGKSFKTIRVSDLVMVNPEGKVVHGNAPINVAAFAIHSQIHQSRPEVVAAAHAHAVHGKALAALHQQILPITQDACIFFEDNVLIDGFNGIVHSLEEGKRIASKLGRCKLGVMANHGLLTVGRSVEEAAALFMIAERCAQVQLLASAAGRMQLIPDDVARYTHDQEAHQENPHWHAFLPTWDEMINLEPDLLL